MAEYRIARADEFEACIDLADRVFQGAGAQIEFRKALPKVYAGRSGMERYHRVAADGRGLIALIAVLPGRLHTVCGDLSTGYVGTVSVREDARGEGHMKRLMADWIEAEKARGCDLMLLGGQRQRYGYFGFAQGGERWRLTLTRPGMKHALRSMDASRVVFREILPGTPDERWADALHRSGRAYFDRSMAGFALTCRSYHHTPWIAEEDGIAVGCLVAEQEDPREIKECQAAGLPALDRMMKAWREQHEVCSLQVRVPVWDRETLLHLRAWAEHTECSPVLMIRVLNYPRVIETLLNLKACWTALADGELPLCVDGQSFTVTVRGNVCHVTDGAYAPVVLTGLQAGAMLFDPFPQEGIPQTAGSWFPLPLSSCAADDF